VSLATHEDGEVMLGTMHLERDEFRHAMSQFPTGVALVTISANGERRGITVNSLTSVSLEPPMLLVCFHRNSAVLERLKRVRTFAVNVLSTDQQEIATRFGRPETAGNSHSLDDAMASDIDGVPTLADCLTAIVCDIEVTFEAGSHTVVLASPRRIVARHRQGRGALGFWQSRYLPVGDRNLDERG